MSHRRKTTKSLAVANLSFPGPNRIGIFSLWSRTQENTPRRAAGVSLNLIRAANLTTRRCTKPASPATSLSKLATLSSPITHLDTNRNVQSKRNQQVRFNNNSTTHRRTYGNDSSCDWYQGA